MQKWQQEELDLQLFDCRAIKSNLKITQKLGEKKKKDREREEGGEGRGKGEQASGTAK